ncbi:hypothetical protein [Actinoplanes sp. NPDC026670]|uniref:hypothetical protein n=1 Tax=Actinoplanes sp. NPDC026670 TaxID=3154700 RepID=UPI0033C52670
MRTKWLLAAGLIIAGLTAASFMIFQANGEGTSPDTSTCQLAAPPAATTAADSSGIGIVEQGHSQRGPMASMGVLLRNDTTRVAYRTLVTFDALDPSGRSVINESHQRFRTQVVPVILPGRTIAVGNANLLDDATRRGENEFKTISIDIQVGRWIDRGDRTDGFGESTATIVAGSGRTEPSGLGSMEFDVESTNCETVSQGKPIGMVSRGVSLVFRSESGAVVGGSLDNSPRDTCRPGKKTGERVELTNPGIPQPADLDKTLITVYCDFDRPQGPPASGAPYN